MDAYDTYRQWKGWSDEPFGTCTDLQRNYFAKEMVRAGVVGPSKILELGFGNGEFLEWARSVGHEVLGVEIIDSLVAEASANGFSAYLKDITAEAFVEERNIDVVVAFDVIEHLSIREIQQLLRSLSPALSPEAVIICRFPNGCSPFSSATYNGDITHKTLLAQTSLRQIVEAEGFEVARFVNPVRSLGRIPPLKWLIYLFRDVLEVALGYLYFNNQRWPLDPSAVAHLRRCEAAESKV
ncbi:hypothetical protein DDZ13_10305 [Coraliomargarita sinensis]|uniref:Class I SAM-dependent methyltransferase n=1 Tax=Coraliomargarita sinensis TaxID=2174842 RepID=A0A317ZIF1_9BACT|nr:methyltransferase domain-containing protein [Coraliomargarita sinensis]PXA03678.1 hypothetical protein DDZ13_10305 [Coraliomargarita sinensis]